MKHFVRRAAFFFVILSGCAGISAAQQTAPRPQRAPARLHAYDAARETVLAGVFLNYEAAGGGPRSDRGGRILLQTENGSMTADLGPAGYLAARHFSLAPGDPVKLAGVSSATRQGTVFLARVIEKGGQSLVLRTAQGAPLAIAGGEGRAAQAKRQGSAR